MEPHDRSLGLEKTAERSQGPWSPRNLPELKPPRTLLAALLRVAHLRTSLALMAPAVCGVVLALWEQNGALQTLPLIFALVGSFAAAVGLNTLSEFYDYRRSLMVSEQTSNLTPTTGFDILVNSIVQPGFAHSVALFAVVLSGLCMAWSALLGGWPLLFFGALSLLLTATYSAPPINYGYRNWGLGEVGVWLNFGLLQMLIGYYAQAHTLTWTPFWLSIPFGVLVALCVHNFNFIYFRRDWLIHKRTLVVQFGPERAVDLSTILVVSAFVALLVIASFALLPLRILVTLLALPTAVGVFSQLDRDAMNLREGVLLSRTTANATILTAILFCLILLLDKI